ncbi:MAG: hypothetical protein J6Q79_00435 [Clostridia bacterium]|nr:hypothetical protein [Clostridia bacterium]
MDKIRQWTLSVCAVSIISGLLMSVLPKSSQKSFCKVIVSVMMLYTVMHPVISSNGIDFSIDDFLSDNYQLSETYDKYARSAMIKSAEKAIADTLKNKAYELGIDCNFTCECIEENEQITVTRITVAKCNDADSKDKITGMIYDSGFKETDIVFEGE